MYETAFHNQDINKISFLVTGGAGFIGSNIIAYLTKHGAAKVRIFDNLSTGFKRNIEPFVCLPNVEFIRGDIRDAELCVQACQGIDYVLHQAALGSVPRSIKDPVATNQSNVDGFLNILVAAKETAVKRVVYASSSSVYGDSPVLPKTEDKIGIPLSPYAVSKYVNELYANVFAKCYNLEIIGLRYFNVFGPNQSPQGAYAAAIPLFMSGLLNNVAPFIHGDGTQTRDFTFVENAVQANIKAVFTQNPNALGNIFNIALGDRTSVNELFNILKQISGSLLVPEYCDERPGDIKDSLADISKAKQLLDFAPQVKIYEGLKITFDWFKQNVQFFDGLV
ncbi:MAG: SDR family oxidoreductase [Bacteroidota bacterium]